MADEQYKIISACSHQGKFYIVTELGLYEKIDYAGPMFAAVSANTPKLQDTFQRVKVKLVDDA